MNILDGRNLQTLNENALKKDLKKRSKYWNNTQETSKKL